jgi:hypothetical protein
MIRYHYGYTQYRKQKKMPPESMPGDILIIRGGSQMRAAKWKTKKTTSPSS